MNYYLLFMLSVLQSVYAGELSSKYVMKVIDANHPAIRYVGRTLVADNGDVSFDWVGTYFELNLESKNVSIKASDTGVSYYNIFIDDELHKVVRICSKDTLINIATNLTRGTHRLRMQKRSEGEFGKTTIHKVVLPTSGKLLEAPEKRMRHIEFIGNSLTCGYGTEGKDRDAPFLVETENCNLTFAAMIARYYDTDYTMVAHSGRGAVRNYGDSVRVSKNTMLHKMTNTFDEDASYNWDFEKYTPDLVVINLGSNDFSSEPYPHKSEFIEGYGRIIAHLRQNYGQIPILCIYPSVMQASVFDYYVDLLKSLSDPKVHLYKLKEDLYNNTTDLGAGWHPGYLGHKKMAMSLIPYISTITDWELTNKTVE